METATFDALFEQVSTWGRWGADDQRGALNHLTPEAVTAAAGLVRSGRTVSLAHDLDTAAGPDNPRPALHYMTQLADVGEAEPRVNTDFVGMDFHGKSVTHVDALCHCVYRGRLYNGFIANEHVGSDGGHIGTIDQLSQGVVTRGVLVDLPRALGVDWLEPSTAIGEKDTTWQTSALSLLVSVQEWANRQRLIQLKQKSLCKTVK